MRHASKMVTVLATLVAALAFAACGSDHDGNGGHDGGEEVSGQFEPIPDAPAGYGALAGEATLKRVDGSTVASLRLTGLRPNAEYVAHLHSGGCNQADPGGPHFKFDPDGTEEPPNEIHLEFRSGADGSGDARTSSKGEVPAGEAGSIVLHEGESEHTTSSEGAEEGGEAVLVHAGHHHEDEAPAPPGEIACAELEGGRSHSDAHEESASRGGKVTTIVVRDGEPVGGIQELEYDAGDEIRFEVESDVADEVHVHGYDLMEEVSAGGTVSFDFPAEIEGIFEVELEGRREQIAELRVNP